MSRASKVFGFGLAVQSLGLGCLPADGIAYGLFGLRNDARAHHASNRRRATRRRAQRKPHQGGMLYLLGQGAARRVRVAWRHMHIPSTMYPTVWPAVGTVSIWGV